VTRHFLALGDSYTIGEGVGVSERWPVQLAAATRKVGLPLADPIIVARTGWTTSELRVALDTSAPPLREDHDLVSLLIGVNDQYRGLGVEAFRDGFVELVSKAVRYAVGDASRVIVMSIPDWSVTPFARGDRRPPAAIADEIDRFNRVARDETHEIGAAFVDVTAISREARNDRALLAADELHPSASMYARWVVAMTPFVAKALTR
jgi:lysophospholipase L1-like esterase